MGPAITVLLPVWNEAETIAETLGDLAAQTFDDFEVIVVDGGSSDATIEIIRDFGIGLDLQIIEHGRPSTPEQLNVALRKSRGRYVARVDGHLRLPTTYLETVHRHLSAGYDAVGTRKTAVGSSRFGRALAASLNSDASTGGSAYHHEKAVCLVDHVPYGAYDRDLLIRLGGWDERLLANQDVELDQRVGDEGGRILLDGTISTLWISKNTPRQAWRQFRRYGRGRAMTARIHPSSIRPRHLALAGLAIVTPFAGLAALVHRRWALVLVVQPALDLILAAREHRRQRSGQQFDPVLVALSAFAMYLTQLAWGLSFVEGLVELKLLDPERRESSIRCKDRTTYG